MYGRVGTSTGENGTLTTYLLDAVNLVAGNLDRPGGSMFGRFGMPGERWGKKALGALLRTIYTRRRSRIGGFPSVLASEPAGVMAKEITTPGRGQVRALFVSAGNPVLSVPNGNELEEALDGLELMVGIDLYVNETLAHCDYVLPAATMYERDDFPLPFQTLQPTPFRQATEAVVAPVGQARAEWEIIDDLTRRMWRRTPGLAMLAATRKALSLFGVRLTPRLLVDAVIRLGEGGDLYGLRRGGLTFARLAADHPHGKVLAPNLRDGVLRKVVVYRGGRVRLRHDEIAAEVEALSRRRAPDGYPMRLIGMRETRSENSWMHNAPLLMRGDRIQHARMHVDDAAAANIVDGDRVRIASRARRDRAARHRHQGHRCGRGRGAARLGPQGHRRLAGGQRRGRCERQPTDVQRAGRHRETGRDGAADRRADPGHPRFVLTPGRILLIAILNRRRALPFTRSSDRRGHGRPVLGVVGHGCRHRGCHGGDAGRCRCRDSDGRRILGRWWSDDLGVVEFH